MSGLNIQCDCIFCMPRIRRMDSMNCNTTLLSRPTVLRRSINFSQDFLEDLEAIQLVKRVEP